MKIFHTALRPTAALLRQVSLSVAATLIATAIVTSLRTELPLLRPAAAVVTPLMTRGGKFAARVETPAASTEDADTITVPGTLPPLLAVEATHPLMPVRLLVGEALPVPNANGFLHSTKHMVSAEVRRRVAVAAPPLLPPRRADFIAAEPVLPNSTATLIRISDVWSSAKESAGRAASLVGAIWDRVTPVQLVP